MLCVFLSMLMRISARTGAANDASAAAASEAEAIVAKRMALSDWTDAR
jgi:hypothetical protein